MPDKIVYLVTKVTAALRSADLLFVDDAALSDALAQGYEVSTTLPDRTVMVGGKKVRATMIVLKSAAENRGVSIRDDESGEHPRQGGRNIVTVDQFGIPRSVTAAQGMLNALEQVSRALMNTGSAGHLGSAPNHNIPGMNIVSGELVAKAFDVGVNAGMAGHDASTCPFPPQSIPGQRWLQGLRTAERRRDDAPAPSAMAGARQAGAVAARDFGQDDEVACPFPPQSPLRTAWVEGFREAGGRVE